LTQPALRSSASCALRSWPLVETRAYPYIGIVYLHREAL
jgi:hypothetical protein